jgi:hypothetical protein
LPEDTAPAVEEELFDADQHHGLNLPV